MNDEIYYSYNFVYLLAYFNHPYVIGLLNSTKFEVMSENIVRYMEFSQIGHF